MSLILGLGLEHSCPWPRECLSSEWLSLALDFFFVSLALASNLVSSTPPLDINMLKTVYYSLIYSHVQYCITTWGVASATALERLEKMHNCVIRIITNSPFRSHTASIFKEFNSRKINDVFKLKIAEKMQKYKNNPQLYSIQTISDIEKTHN